MQGIFLLFPFGLVVKSFSNFENQTLLLFSTGQGKIPADATLVFEVELFDWSGEDLSEAKDGGIMHRTLEAGSEYDKPTDNSALEGNKEIIAWLDDIPVKRTRQTPTRGL